MSDELDAIRQRSANGSADWDDPIADARWLLSEVDRLQEEVAQRNADITLRDEILKHTTWKSGLDHLLVARAAASAIGKKQHR